MRERRWTLLNTSAESFLETGMESFENATSWWVEYYGEIRGGLGNVRVNKSKQTGEIVVIGRKLSTDGKQRLLEFTSAPASGFPAEVAALEMCIASGKFSKSFV